MRTSEIECQVTNITIGILMLFVSILRYRLFIYGANVRLIGKNELRPLTSLKFDSKYKFLVYLSQYLNRHV